MSTGLQQQLITYKRGYYDRGLEIEKLNAKVSELEATIKKQEKELTKLRPKKGDK